MHGTKVVFSGSTGRFDAGTELAALQIRGKIQTYELSITHPVVMTRWHSLLLDTGFAAKDNRLFINGTLTGHDTVRMVTLGVNYDRVDLYGRTHLSAYGFHGLGEILGGWTITRPSAPGRGPTAGFSKARSPWGVFRTWVMTRC